MESLKRVLTKDRVIRLAIISLVSTLFTTFSAPTVTWAAMPASELRMDLRAFEANSYGGTGTNWNDLSTNNNDATLRNGPTWSSAAGAFTLDGTDDYFDLPVNPSSFKNFTSGVSISVVANFGIANNWERLIDIGSGQANHNIIFARNGGSDDLTFEIYQSSTSLGKCTAPNGILNNKWATYAAVANGSTCTLYRDGVQLVSQTYNAGSPQGLPVNIDRSSNFLGKSNWADALFQGGIRAIALYGRALNATEVNDARRVQEDPNCILGSD